LQGSGYKYFLFALISLDHDRATQKELLLSDLDSMPFRQAQMKTNRRVSLKI